MPSGRGDGPPPDGIRAAFGEPAGLGSGTSVRCPAQRHHGRAGEARPTLEGSSQVAMKSGIDLDAFDRSTRPQDDLFRFVNGTWIDTTEIPGDRARFGTFDVLREQSTARVRDLIEEAAASHDGAPGTPHAAGRRPLRELHGHRAHRGAGPRPAAGDARRGRVGDRRRGPRVARSGASSATASTGRSPTGSGPTSARPEDYVVYLEQHGLGLPDESYYREEKYAEIRVGLRRPHRAAARPGRHPRGGGQGRAHHGARDAARGGALGQRDDARRDQDLQRAHPRRGQGARAPVPLGRLAVRPPGAGGVVRQGRRARSRASSRALGAR